MSLNNISLPSKLLADLYQNVLIQDTATAVPITEPIPFLGKNGKNILILVNKKKEAYLPEKELQFLTTVLSACQLDLSAVAIVNWFHLKQKSFAAVSEQFKPKQLLLLDVEPEEIGLFSMPSYTVTSFSELQAVTAPSLTTIESSVETKKLLWAALKKLFCL